jgi:FkbM family methyltransferase
VNLASSDWEAGTVAAIRMLCGPGKYFWDIGCWIGPTSLLAASRGSNVVAFEPDIQAIQRFNRNVSQNPHLRGRIQLVTKALSRNGGKNVLKAQGEFGNSMASLVGRGGAGILVDSMSAQGAIAAFSLPRESTVKIDIEGGEYSLGFGFWKEIVQRRCSILLSTHPSILAPWYRIPSRARANRLAATVIGFIPSCRVFYRLRKMDFFGDYAPGEGTFKKLSTFRALVRFVGGRNHSFLCRPRLT